MNPETWQQVCQAFDAACDLAPAERSEFLKQLRADNPTIAAQVEDMLRQEEEESVISDAMSTEIWDHIADQTPKKPDSSKWPETIGPYTVERELGRGGMGVVLRVRDDVFGRALAVKLLSVDENQRDEAHARFLSEARLMGWLQHPGIPPVHDLGALPDGRPYFAMKLIAGQTLSELLAQTSESRGAAAQRLTTIFKNVCQTMAYAHEQGVIHRDLKPSNIMVGEFGEVQVMDWGLARQGKSDGEGSGEEKMSHKPLDGTPGENNPGENTPNSPHPMTQTGQLMGTPAYMAPEQARGDVHALDERCDVFGLGAILCTILTGKPAFQGNTLQNVLDQATRGDLNDAYQRLETCGADEALIAVARRCLAPEREDRPNNAGELATAVEAYEADVRRRLQRAELDRTAAQVQATEERKRREVERQKRRWTMVAAVAAVLLVIAVAGAAVWWYQADAAAAAARGKRLAKVESALDRTESMRNATVSQIRKDGLRPLLNEPEIWGAAQATLTETLKRAKDLAGDEELPGELQERIEQLTQLVDHDDKDRKTAVALENVRKGPAYTVKRRSIGRGTLEEYREVFRSAGFNVADGDLKKMAPRIKASLIREQLVAALDHWAWMIWVVKKGNDRPKAKYVPRRHLRLARMVDPHPMRDRVRDPDLWHNRGKIEALITELLNAPEEMKNLSPAMLTLIGHMRPSEGQHVAWLRRAQSLHPNDFWLNLDLGRALESSDPKEATTFYAAALALRPKSAVVHNNLGLAFYRRKNLTDAVRHLEKAVEYAPRSAIVHSNLAFVLHAVNERERAVSLLRRAVKLAPKFSMAYYNLGKILQDKGETAESIRNYRSAIQFDPKYSEAHCNLGMVLISDNKRAEGMDHLKTAIKLDPLDAIAINAYGHSLLSDNKIDAAIDHFRKAIDRNPRFLLPYNNWALALRRRKDFAGAEAILKKALAVDANDVAAHFNLALVLRDQGKRTDSVRSFERALQKLRPNDSLRLLVDNEIRAHVAFARNRNVATVTEKLILADVCWRYLNRYREALTLYQNVFAADSNAINRFSYRYHAACCAVMTAAGKSRSAQQLEDDEKTKLRKLAKDWLEAEFTSQKRNLASRPSTAPTIYFNLSRWLRDQRLAVVRDDPQKLSAADQAFWTKFWRKVADLKKTARDGYTETFARGTLTDFHKQRHHVITLKADRVYVIDMTSRAFDTLVRIETADGVKVAEDDDGGPGLDSRVTFTPRETGEFRIIATSYRLRGRGDYIVSVREILTAGK